MTLIHPPTLGGVLVGAILTFLDLCLYLRHETYEMFSNLRLHSPDDLVILETTGLAILQRDAAGRIVGVAESRFGRPCTCGLNDALRDLDTEERAVV